MTELNIGDVVDSRYELRRVLGQGAEAVVYEALQRFTEQRVALKVMSIDADPEMAKKRRARIHREARVLGRLKHPGIVVVYDAGDFGDRSYIALEILDGKTLEGVLAVRTALSLEDAAVLMLLVSDAIAFAHKKNVVHRDIKPSNLLVCLDVFGDERVKVLDFGTSKPHEVDVPKVTDPGAPIGTPAYMSPEQMMGREDVDARADIYALGAVFFECLTGQPLYSGTYPDIVKTVVTSELPPALAANARKLDARSHAVLEKCLHRDRAKRYQSAAELDVALRALLPQALPRLRVLTAKSAQELRRFGRAPYITPVRVTLGSRTIDGRCEDMSEGGMLFLTREECTSGQTVSLRFALPIEGTLVTTSATVKWVKEAHGGGGMRAFGLEFLALPDVARSSIARYVALMSPR